MNNIYLLKNIFNSNIEKKNILNELKFTQTLNSKWGDYQTNYSMKTFKKFNAKNPREYGQELIQQLKNIKEISRISIEGPGFLNVKLSDEYLSLQLDKIIKNNNPLIYKATNIENIVIDYSSPNIAKQMHVGHLRSTIIGDTLSNIYEVKGHKINRINHLGDWGTQFGMLIAYIKINNISLEKVDIDKLNIWYKESKILFDSDKKFNDFAHNAVVKLQEENDDYINIWKEIYKISLESYKEIYDRLNISSELKVYGESYYNNILDKIVAELDKLNLLEIHKNAKLFFVGNNKTPLIVKKGDGGYGYDTTDLAAIKYRIYNMKANRIIYVTDQGQSLHFKLIFEAAHKIGWIENQSLNHVPFGLVLGNDGKKIKSRSGESLKLLELLNEAKKYYFDHNTSRNSLNESYNEKISEIIGVSAIKYYDLKQNRINDYKLDIKKMLDNKGDTIVYQLYSWVRIQNIIRKKNFKEDVYFNSNYSIKFDNAKEYESERDLLLHLTKVDEILDRIMETLNINHLCEYMYFLAMKFNNFWRDCRVIDNKFEITRIKLCYATKIVMLSCFNILKIPAQEIIEL